MSARLERAVLAAAAHEYLRAGWPVAPGAWWSPQLQRYRCGRARCRTSSPHAVDPGIGPSGDRCRASVAQCVVTTPTEVDRWWTDHPYALLMPTSTGPGVVDGVEDIITMVDEKLRAEGHLAPLSTSKAGQAQLFCQPLRPSQELWLSAAGVGVLLHGEDSWVTLPPSTVRTGQVRWLRSPQECGWRLPSAAVVSAALRAALTFRARPVVNGRRG
jgi:hypothetical protein